jgi:dsDNA-specific endonuclease/ATPase MutS2
MPDDEQWDQVEFPEEIEIPIDGVLDLHTFSPRDVKDLVPTYLDECLHRGITQVRIIHGKGTGALRRTVHAILERYPWVIDYRHEDGSGGSWGATVVRLRRPDRGTSRKGTGAE